jgi:ribonuclease P protein component
LSAAALGRLRKRSEFLAVAAANRRANAPGLGLQARVRRHETSDEAGFIPPSLRIGFTATKKLGNAVMRNRARRRLRAAVHDVLAKGDFPLADGVSADLVLLARPGTLTRSFTDLKGDLSAALARLGLKR